MSDMRKRKKRLEGIGEGGFVLVWMEYANVYVCRFDDDGMRIGETGKTDEMFVLTVGIALISLLSFLAHRSFPSLWSWSGSLLWSK